VIGDLIGVAATLGLLLGGPQVGGRCLHARRVPSTCVQQLLLDRADAAADVEHAGAVDPAGAEFGEQPPRRLRRPALAVALEVVCGSPLAEHAVDALAAAAGHDAWQAQARPSSHSRIES
jgi:hypothetical protein